MNPIEPIGAAVAAAIQGTQPSVGAQLAAGGDSFSQMVVQGLTQVDRTVAAGEQAVQQLVTGQVQNLHQVMIQLEESRLSMQLLMQVRSRLLEAYQDVIKMQI